MNRKVSEAVLRKKVFSLAVKVDKILHEKARNFFKRELAEKLEKYACEVLPRVFEYSFTVKNLPKEGRVLDVGCTASSNALPIILAELGHKVYGVDLRPFKVKCSNFEFIICDARHLPFRGNVFECCYGVSTIEHIGLPGVWGPTGDLEGDSSAVKEMINVVKPGSLLIITVPFGKSDIFPDSRIYDIEDIERLFEGLKIVEEEYIIERDGVWFKASRDEAAKADHEAGCRAVGMFKLHKQERNNKH